MIAKMIAVVAVLVPTCVGVAVGWRLGRGVDLIELWGQIRREIFRSPHPRHVLHLRLDGAFFSTVISNPRSDARVRLRLNAEKIVCSGSGGAELFEVSSSSPDAPARVGRYVNAFLDGADDWEADSDAVV